MKRRIAMAVFISLITLSAAAQTRKPDRETDELQGPVKMVRTEIANLGDDGKPNKNGRWLSRITSYDVRGNKTEDETFYAFGKISYGKLIYAYDASGNLIEEANHINGAVIKTAYTHNDQSAPNSDGASWVNHLKYDSEGRLKERIRASGSGSVSSRQVFRYDDKGQLIWWGVYEREKLSSESIITYDEKGRLSSETNGKDPEERFYNKVINSYDDKDNRIKEERFDEKGLWQLTTYSYGEFDGIGNWTKRTATYSRRGYGPSVEETYRTITYYEK